MATPVKFATLHIFDIFNGAGPDGMLQRRAAKQHSTGQAPVKFAALISMETPVKLTSYFTGQADPPSLKSYSELNPSSLWLVAAKAFQAWADELRRDRPTPSPSAKVPARQASRRTCRRTSRCKAPGTTGGMDGAQKLKNFKFSV